VATRGPRLPLILSGALLTVGSLVLLPMSAHESFVVIIAAFVVYAGGFGLVNAPITNTAVSGMPRAQAGVAAAVASTSRQVGATLGVAVVGSVVSASIGRSVRTELVPASHVAWAVIAGFNVIVLVLGALSTGTRARETARRNADLLEGEPALV
jgi:predicted MFS family arabinose efflux permease